MTEDQQKESFRNPWLFVSLAWMIAFIIAVLGLMRFKAQVDTDQRIQMVLIRMLDHKTAEIKELKEKCGNACR